MSADDPTKEDGLASMLRSAGPRGDLEEERALSEIRTELFGRAPRRLTLSRYVLLERIAAGGAGIVYAAYDPELDRKVAIKLLHPSLADSADTEQARSRLQREAQALAKLAHPNVIAIYDVGTYDDRELGLGKPDSDGEPRPGVFVVMELVEGVTLADWFAERPRHWREVLPVLTAAGRGLAAAHGSGVVHRDFKPRNVLVGDDGRVRVLDFGLARPVLQEVEDDESLPSGQSTPVSLVTSLTHPGAVVGTPAYMSPEQHRGEPTDERADVFGFCASFYEALYRQRPFRGKTMDTLREAKEKGKIRSPPTSVNVPAWLHRTVVRGLAPDPADRFESVTAVLSALDRLEKRRRRGWAVAGLGALGAGILAIGLGSEPAAVPEQCSGYEAQLTGIWDDEVREQVRAAFGRSGQDFAADSFESVERLLDGHSVAWLTARQRACEETVVQQGVSQEAMASRVICLERNLRDAASVTSLLAEGERDIVEHGVQIAAGLDPPAICLDPRVSTLGELPIDPENRERVQALESELARSRALRDAGRRQAARELLDAGLPRAAELGYAPIHIEMLLWSSNLRAAAGDVAEAEDDAYQALNLAERVGSHRWTIISLAYLVNLVGAGTDPQHAERLVDQAWAKWDYQPLDTGVESTLNYKIGLWRLRQGRFEDALASFAPSMEQRLELGGPDHYPYLKVVHGQARALEGLGRFDEAVDVYQQILDSRLRALGSKHPEIADACDDLGGALRAAGQLEAALEQHEAAMRIRRAAYPAEDVRHARSHAALAATLTVLGRKDEAEQHVAAGRRLLERDDAILPVEYADTMHSLGESLEELDQPREALILHELGLRTRRATLGNVNPDVGFSLAAVARTWKALGVNTRAIGLNRQAMVRWERALDPTHPARMRTARELGELELARANDLWEQDPIHARDLADRAKHHFELGGDADGRAAVVAWLDEHREPEPEQ